MLAFLKRHLTIIVLAFAVLLMLGLCLFFRIMEPVLGRDSVLYIDLARVWHETGSIDGAIAYWPRFWFPPLSLYLGTLLMKCGLSPEWAMVGMNLVMGCCLPLIIYGLAKVVTESERIALCSAVLIAVNPSVIRLALEAQRDMPYMFFCGLSWLFVCLGIRHEKVRNWLVAGILFSFSLLIRYETLEFVPVFGIYFIYRLIREKEKRIALLHQIGALLGAMVLTLLILLKISGTASYVERQYQHYYDRKFQLLLEQVNLIEDDEEE